MTVDFDTTKARYPWRDWTDGEVKAVAVRGETEMDAMERVKRLRNSLYVHSKRHDLSVRTLVDYAEEHVMVRFQFCPKGAEDSDFSEVFSTGTLHDIEMLALDETGVPL
jgi:hypothetical protein